MQQGDVWHSQRAGGLVDSTISMTPYIQTDITRQMATRQMASCCATRQIAGRAGCSQKIEQPMAPARHDAPGERAKSKGGNIMNYPDIELYIDGRWKRASGQPVINPADESVLGTVPTATRADLDDALAAAQRGFAVWRKTSPAKRTQIILKAASLIRASTRWRWR
jgi:Aldehyde dehydrogenase family